MLWCEELLEDVFVYVLNVYLRSRVLVHVLEDEHFYFGDHGLDLGVDVGGGVGDEVRVQELVEEVVGVGRGLEGLWLHVLYL